MKHRLIITNISYDCSLFRWTSSRTLIFYSQSVCCVWYGDEAFDVQQSLTVYLPEALTWDHEAEADECLSN